MALNHSPKIVTDGLVFAYDLANTKKSWKGAPTTNLFGTNLIATNATKAISTSKFVGSYNGWSAIGISTDNPRAILFNGSLAINASTFYTLSCLYWSSNNIVDDVYLRFSDTGWVESANYIQPFTSQVANRNGSFSITDLGSGWKYCIGNFQTLATTTTLEQLFFDVDIAGVQVFMTNIQLEQNTTATPYVEGTRSNTQSIIDLTGSNTVTANSLTYASDGTFSFNGSDRVEFNMPGSASLTKYTRIVWIKPTVISGEMKSIMLNTVGNNSDMAVGIEAGYPAFHQYTNSNSSGTVSGDWTLRGATLMSTNNTYMIAVTVDRTISTNNVKVYLNGILDGIASNTLGISASDVVIIGGPVADSYAGGRMFYGNVYAASMYNVVLPAAEIKQNFNAHRGRYVI